MKMKIPHNQLTKRLWLLVAGAGLLFASAAQAEFIPVPLIANGGSATTATIVGDVGLDLNGVLTVTLNTEPDWCITTIHVAIGCDISDTPQTKKGEPIPGQYGKKTSDDYTGLSQILTGCVDSQTVPVPVPVNCPATFDVAVHTVVRDESSTEDTDLAAALLTQNPYQCPEGEIEVYKGKPDAYLDTHVFDNKGDWRGVYEGWCIDIRHGIAPNTRYSCKFYASDADLTGLSDDDVIQNSDKMDLVNWIINQEFVGQPGPSSCEPDAEYGTDYTFGDVQQTIWAAMNHAIAPDDEGTIYPWSECRATVIGEAAIDHGDGYEPGPGDLHGIICDTVTAECGASNEQTTMFIYRTANEETAWGGGPVFPESSSWGMYIQFPQPTL